MGFVMVQLVAALVAAARCRALVCLVAARCRALVCLVAAAPEAQRSAQTLAALLLKFGQVLVGKGLAKVLDE